MRLGVGEAMGEEERARRADADMEVDTGDGEGGLIGRGGEVQRHVGGGVDSIGRSSRHSKSPTRDDTSTTKTTNSSQEQHPQTRHDSNSNTMRPPFSFPSYPANLLPSPHLTVPSPSLPSPTSPTSSSSQSSSGSTSPSNTISPPRSPLSPTTTTTTTPSQALASSRSPTTIQFPHSPKLAASLAGGTPPVGVVAGGTTSAGSASSFPSSSSSGGVGVGGGGGGGGAGHGRSASLHYGHRRNLSRSPPAFGLEIGPWADEAKSSSSTSSSSSSSSAVSLPPSSPSSSSSPSNGGNGSGNTTTRNAYAIMALGIVGNGGVNGGKGNGWGNGVGIGKGKTRLSEVVWREDKGDEMVKEGKGKEREEDGEGMVGDASGSSGSGKAVDVVGDDGLKDVERGGDEVPNHFGTPPSASSPPSSSSSSSQPQRSNNAAQSQSHFNSNHHGARNNINAHRPTPLQLIHHQHRSSSSSPSLLFSKDKQDTSPLSRSPRPANLLSPAGSPPSNGGGKSFLSSVSSSGSGGEGSSPPFSVSSPSFSHHSPPSSSNHSPSSSFSSFQPHNPKHAHKSQIPTASSSSSSSSSASPPNAAHRSLPSSPIIKPISIPMTKALSSGSVSPASPGRIPASPVSALGLSKTNPVSPKGLGEVLGGLDNVGERSEMVGLEGANGVATTGMGMEDDFNEKWPESPRLSHAQLPSLSPPSPSHSSSLGHTSNGHPLSTSDATASATGGSSSTSPERNHLHKKQPHLIQGGIGSSPSSSPQPASTASPPILSPPTLASPKLTPVRAFPDEMSSPSSSSLSSTLLRSSPSSSSSASHSEDPAKGGDRGIGGRYRSNSDSLGSEKTQRLDVEGGSGSGMSRSSSLGSSISTMVMGSSPTFRHSNKVNGHDAKEESKGKEKMDTGDLGLASGSHWMEHRRKTSSGSVSSNNSSTSSEDSFGDDRVGRTVQDELKEASADMELDGSPKRVGRGNEERTEMRDVERDVEEDQSREDNERWKNFEGPVKLKPTLRGIGFQLRGGRNRGRASSGSPHRSPSPTHVRSSSSSPPESDARDHPARPESPVPPRPISPSPPFRLRPARSSMDDGDDEDDEDEGFSEVFRGREGGGEDDDVDMDGPRSRHGERGSESGGNFIELRGIPDRSQSQNDRQENFDHLSEPPPLPPSSQMSWERTESEDIDTDPVRLKGVDGLDEFGGGSDVNFGEMSVQREEDDGNGQSSMGDGGGLAGEGLGAGEGDEQTMVDLENLSALDKLFLYAQSTEVEHRVSASRLLADWIQEVEICEAVEYILPFLGNLATDEEDAVKEAFALRLDAVMWYFFSRCPLAELDDVDDEQNGLEASNPDKLQQDATRDTDESELAAIVDKISPSPSDAESNVDKGDGTPTTTSTARSDTSSGSTLPTNDDFQRAKVQAPRISATTFTPLLRELLRDPYDLVQERTRQAIVKFLCRLLGKSPPEDYPDTSEALLSEEAAAAIESQAHEPHSHFPYEFDETHRKFVENEVIDNVVLGISGIENRRDQGSEHSEGASMNIDSTGGSSTVGSVSDLDEIDEDCRFVGSGDGEDQTEEGWSTLAYEDSQRTRSSPRYNQPLRSMFDDRSDSDVPIGGSPAGSVIFNGSHRHADGSADAWQNRVASMHVITDIAQAMCVDEKTLAEKMAPAVARMDAEPVSIVRVKAAHALGALAEVVPVETLISLLMPVYEVFSRDSSWSVRAAICVSLPDICSRLPPDLKHSTASLGIRLFSSDSSDKVRTAFFDRIGATIYAFHDDSSRLPPEALQLFLGEPLTPKASSSLSTANEIGATFMSSSPFFTPPSHQHSSSPFFGESQHYDMASIREQERQAIRAWNFPAVVLTLGPERWSAVRELHRTLCSSDVVKIRRSLASSLHEIARIIGPQAASEDLAPLISDFLRDRSEEVKSVVLDGFDVFLSALPRDTALLQIRVLGDVWDVFSKSSWRLREKAASLIGELAKAYADDGDRSMVALLMRALQDEVAAVRQIGVNALPEFFLAAQKDKGLLQDLLDIVSSLATDFGFRRRTTAVSILNVLLQSSAMTEQDISQNLLPVLQHLSADSVVDVRIGFARAVGTACTQGRYFANRKARDEIVSRILWTFSTDKEPLIRSFLEDIEVDAPAPALSRDSPPQSSSTSATSSLLLTNGPVKSDFGDKSNERERSKNAGESDTDEDEDEDDLSLSGSIVQDLDLDPADDEALDEEDFKMDIDIDGMAGTEGKRRSMPASTATQANLFDDSYRSLGSGSKSSLSTPPSPSLSSIPLPDPDQYQSDSSTEPSTPIYSISSYPPAPYGAFSSPRKAPSPLPPSNPPSVKPNGSTGGGNARITSRKPYWAGIEHERERLERDREIDMDDEESGFVRIDRD